MAAPVPDDAAARGGEEALHAFVAADRRRALAAGRPLPERPTGAALFADVSGFTSLTEALAGELGPQRGAEELTIVLDRVFDALISELDRHGGDVVYFSGDAITCWLDGDEGRVAVACALAMQRRIDGLADVVTPRGTHVRLALKAAVAAGTARRFVVGDPDIQRIDVLAGGLIDALASGERLADRGEVLVHEPLLLVLGSSVKTRGTRRDPDNGLAFAVVEGVDLDVATNTSGHGDVRLPDEVLRPWLQPAVYERMRAGSDGFGAELRPAYPLFLRFGGIDYDRDEHAVTKLDAFVRRVQRILADYGGTLLHVTIGDKGAYLAAVFGSPVAHEDDAARACTAALALRDLAAESAVTGFQIGLTYGRLRSGPCGHARRMAFTCFGDAVNVAARLMAAAPARTIFAAESLRRAAGGGFSWTPVAPLAVKGKAEPVAALQLVGSAHRSRAAARHDLPLVGRHRELAALCDKLAQAFSGAGQVVGIVGEAGMGKSRLLAEFRTHALPRETSIAIGECQSYGANAAYFAWRGVWSTLFGLDDRASPGERVRALHVALAQIDAELVPRAPLLAGVLDLPIADNDLTAAFDAKLRKTSLEALLADCLRALAGDRPRVLVVEDCHWIDALSRDLLVALARAVPDLPVLLVVAYRPAVSPEAALGIEQLRHFAELRLTELSREDVASLVRAKLANEPHAPSGQLVELIAQRAEGNPFYVEELLEYLRGRAVDLGDAKALRELELPDSLQSLVLSRIDELPEGPRRTLKVSSVLGRAFRADVLVGAYPVLGDVAGVREQLEAMTARNLVSREGDDGLGYAFRHVVTQEVAYESMPFAFRAMLHERAGLFLERGAEGSAGRLLDLLAHHFWHSANDAKKREYLARAGDAAQAAYANAAAIDYFERLAGIVEGTARADVLLKLVRVLDVVGDWKRAEASAADAFGIAERASDAARKAACETALAEVARKQGRYDEALVRLDRAAEACAALGDDAGLGRVLHLKGTVAAQRGNYAGAVESYEASLAIRERLDDRAAMAALLSNLGIVEEYRGQHDLSRQFHERALALRTVIGDRRGIGNSTNCLGMVAVHQKRYAEARDWFQRSMAINREIGERWMMAICHNNLGNATRGLGDYAAARRHYAESLRAHRDYDDRWALAFLLEDIGLLAALEGDGGAALELLGAADAAREAIGAPRSAALEEEIAQQIRPALAGLPADEREAQRARGRALDVAAALARAEALVSEPAALTR